MLCFGEGGSQGGGGPPIAKALGCPGLRDLSGSWMGMYEGFRV